MERILRLVKDNEAARLPRLAEEVSENLLHMDGYEFYLQIRGLEPRGFEAG
jgi:hypothetical protein